MICWVKVEAAVHVAMETGFPHDNSNRVTSTVHISVRLLSRFAQVSLLDMNKEGGEEKKIISQHALVQDLPVMSQ